MFKVNSKDTRTTSFQLYTPWKCQKTTGFLTFSGCIEMEWRRSDAFIIKFEQVSWRFLGVQKWNDVILVFLLLTMNRFPDVFWGYRTGMICRSGVFIVNFEQVFWRFLGGREIEWSRPGVFIVNSEHMRKNIQHIYLLTGNLNELP